MTMIEELSTQDADRARETVSKEFCSHALSPMSADPLRVSFRSSRLGQVGFSHLDYGSAVQIAPEPLKTFYLVQLPDSGRARIRQGGREVHSTPNLASVLSPDEPAHMQWFSGTPQSIFYADRVAVEHELSRILGAPLDAPLTFDIGMDMRKPEVEAWQRAVLFVRSEMELGSPLLEDGRHVARVEQMLIAQLILAQPHNFSRRLALGPPATGRTVQQACDLLDEHHSEPLTVTDIAEAVSVSVRTLQDGFRRELDSSPMAYLRERRLLAARTELRQNAASSSSVTEIALRHGFGHLGRFAIVYRKRFGESPSESLGR